MKRKIKEKFITVNKTRTSTAFAVYFFVIFAILIIQLLTCGSQSFESFTFGKQADLQYEILDGHVVDTEFVVKQKNANSIVLNGYSDNDIKFKNEKLIVDFTDAETGENIQHSELLLKDQIDEKNILILFENEISEGTHVKMRVRSLGCEEKGPYIGISETNDSAEYSWIDGELSDSYLCASICYKVKTYNWLKPCVYFLAELLAGLFLLVLHKKTGMPLFSEKTSELETSVVADAVPLKKRVIRIILTLVVVWIVIFILFDYVYMKTMEATVRAKDPEVICEETDETAQDISLKKGESVSQVFTVSENQLSAVAVYIPNVDDVDIRIKYDLYDQQTGEVVQSNKVSTKKIEKLSHHLNKDQRDKIKGALQGYYVLEFSEAIENSAGKQYKIVITNEKTAGGNLELVGGEGEEYPYELNSQPMAGNLCMIALYSNQLIFATMFKYMVIVLTVLLSALIILSGFGRLSVGKTFLISALVLAFVYSFLIPPFCVPDERAHIDAVYTISNEMLGINEIPASGRIYKRADDIDATKENTMDVTTERYRETFENIFGKSADETLQVAYADNPVSNVTFLNYLPAAFGFTIARLLHFNTMTMIMFGRWMNALASILLMWIAIRKLPFGKASFAVFGLFPIILQQIASCSYDGILLGAMFVYFAYAFSLMYSKQKSIFDFGIMLMTGGFAAAACKGGVYIPLLGLILLVCWEIGNNLKEKIGWTLGAAIPVGMVFVGQFSQKIWGMLVRTSGSAYRSGVELYNLSDLLHEPNKLVRIYQNTVNLLGDSYIQESIGGKLGRLNVYIPWYIMIAFLFLVVLSTVTQEGEKSYIRKGQRCFIVLLSSISAGLVMLSMLLAWTQNTYNYIIGVQGRYFLPAIGVLILSLGNNKIKLMNVRKEKMIQIAVLLNTVVCGFALLSVWK